MRSVPTNDRVQLVGQLYPHFIRHSGWVNPITSQEVSGIEKVPSIKINQVEYKTGLQFTANQAFVGNNEAWAYFWLQKKYSKISFIIGPRDNQSTMATGWLTIKGDGKILYEKRLKERDLAEMVVLDVEGINQLSFHSIDELHRLMGGIVFGVVNIFAYPTDYDMSLLPKAGEVNGSKSKVSQLPDVCRLVSNIEPYSVQGIVNYQNSVFRGESEYITFSMGGEKFTLPAGCFVKTDKFQHVMMAMPTTIDSTGVHYTSPTGTAEEMAALEASYEHLCKMRDELVTLEIIPPVAEWGKMNPNL